MPDIFGLKVSCTNTLTMKENRWSLLLISRRIQQWGLPKVILHACKEWNCMCWLWFTLMRFSRNSLLWTNYFLQKQKRLGLGWMRRWGFYRVSHPVRIRHQCTASCGSKIYPPAMSSITFSFSHFHLHHFWVSFLGPTHLLRLTVKCAP